MQALTAQGTNDAKFLKSQRCGRLKFPPEWFLRKLCRLQINISRMNAIKSEYLTGTSRFVRYQDR
jgi:hypothetical protein